MSVDIYPSLAGKMLQTAHHSFTLHTLYKGPCVGNNLIRRIAETSYSDSRVFGIAVNIDYGSEIPAHTYSVHLSSKYLSNNEGVFSASRGGYCHSSGRNREAVPQSAYYPAFLIDGNCGLVSKDSLNVIYESPYLNSINNILRKENNRSGFDFSKRPFGLAIDFRTGYSNQKQPSYGFVEIHSEFSLVFIRYNSSFYYLVLSIVNLYSMNIHNLRFRCLSIIFDYSSI